MRALRARLERGVPLVGRDPRPTPQSRAVEAAAAAQRPSVLPRVGGTEAEAAPADGAYSVARALIPFLTRDDGWLRITPQEDGATVYYKWKWTGGKHVNHYVMTVYPAAESAEALRRLAIKVDAVDSGVQAPVKDHYFKA